MQELKGFRKLKHKIVKYRNIFNTQDLIEIISFFNRKNYKEKSIIIQCEYGKSRSLTLAICLIEYFLKTSHILIHNEYIIRNKVIEKVFDDYFKIKIEK